ncbi:MAG: hypothetical protein ACJARS_002232 [bacterium]|jgi:hypothetical protein
MPYSANHTLILKQPRILGQVAYPSLPPTRPHRRRVPALTDGKHSRESFELFLTPKKVLSGSYRRAQRKQPLVDRAQRRPNLGDKGVFDVRR